MHDLSGTDRRNPRSTATASSMARPSSHRRLPDPRPETNTASSCTRRSRPEHADDEQHAADATVGLLGHGTIWDSKANAHNPMLDEHGRVWYTAVVARRRTRPRTARRSPVTRPRNCSRCCVGPATRDVRPEDREIHAHRHVLLDASPAIRGRREQHVVDERRRSRRRLAEPKMFDETGDAGKSQGWTPLILDTNGNGKRDEYVEPDQPADPTKDKRINAGFYAVMPSPADGSIWGSTSAIPAGRRVDPGPNPPETALAEVYNVPTARLRHRAARTSTATASRGCRSAAATSAASTAASAKDRSTGRRRPAIMPRGLDVLPVSGPGLRRHRRQQRRGELLQLGRSAQHVGPWRNVPIVDRQPSRRRCIALVNGKLVDAARSLSARLLLEGARRPHRRSERRLERPRALGDERRPHAVAQGRRQRTEPLLVHSRSGRIRSRSNAI